jgi:glutathione S-transferase
MPNSPSTIDHLGILYSFRRCPYAMRARVACSLFLPARSLELREVVLKNKPPELIEISPKATVPVLQLKDGNVIDESRDIAFWALEQAALYDLSNKLNAQYLPSHLQVDIEELIDENDGSFKWALDRYKYSDRYEESEQYFRELGEVFLAKLEGLLTKNQYLYSKEPSLADITVFPFVRQFAHVDNIWFNQSPYPKLIQWLNKWLESELFTSIMKKYEPWKPSNETILFPEQS